MDLCLGNGIHYLQSDDFAWDDAKAQANLQANLTKHKISFRAASRVFDDPFVLIEQDSSEDCGEDRFLATGRLEGVLITVAYTDDCVRIISARKADNHEQSAYD